MNVLLLGGNGFIGKNLKEYFFKNRATLNISCPTSKELDLLNEEKIRKYLDKKSFDVVIHSAVGNPSRNSFCKSVSELEQDLKMFFNVAKYNQLYGKMLYFGSGAEFDKNEDIVSVSEIDLYNRKIPTTEYGLAKYIIGQQIEKSENIYNFRVFGLFGKYENWKTTFISGACCKVLKGVPITIRQNVFFDYLYIDDFCRAVDWFVTNKPLFHTYNVTSGKRIDLVSLAKIVRALSKTNVPIYVCRSGLGKEYTASNMLFLRECTTFSITDFHISIGNLLGYYNGILDEIDLYPLLYQ